MIGVSLSGDVSLSQFSRTFAVGSPVDVHVDFGSEPPPTPPPPPIANRLVRPPDRWPYSLCSIGFSSAAPTLVRTSAPTTAAHRTSHNPFCLILSPSLVVRRRPPRGIVPKIELPLLELDALDRGRLARLVARVARQPGDPVDDVHPRRHAAEDGVLAVEPRTGLRGDDEELAAVRVRACVRHREGAALDLVVVDLVLEWVAGPARPRAGRVAALDHEVRDHAVEDDAVVEAVAREALEVLDGLRRVLGEELDLDRAVVRMENGAHEGRLSASGSIAPAVGLSSPDSRPATISRASSRASCSCSGSRIVFTAAATRPSKRISTSTVSSSRRGM